MPAFAFSAIAGTHLPIQEGWKAELAWVAGYVIRQFICPKAVTHPSTNRAQCSKKNCVDRDQCVTATLNRHGRRQAVLDTNWAFTRSDRRTDQSDRPVGPTGRSDPGYVRLSVRPAGQTVAEPPTSVNQINVAC